MEVLTWPGAAFKLLAAVVVISAAIVAAGPAAWLAGLLLARRVLARFSRLPTKEER